MATPALEKYLWVRRRHSGFVIRQLSSAIREIWEICTCVPPASNCMAKVWPCFVCGGCVLAPPPRTAAKISWTTLYSGGCAWARIRKHMPKFLETGRWTDA